MKKVLKRVFAFSMCTVMLTGSVVSMPVSAATSKTMSSNEDFKNIKSLGIVGSFTNWGEMADIPMDDPDGDGIYVGIVTDIAAGDYEFKVRADSNWNNCWGEYEEDYDRTFNSQTNCKLSVDDTTDIIIALDTNGDDFNVWPVSYLSTDKVAPSKYGAVGTMTSWGGDSDAPMYEYKKGKFVGILKNVNKGNYEFKVRADSMWEESYGVYEADYDRTDNSQTNCKVNLVDTSNIIVEFDTTGIDEYIWPISYTVIDSSEKVVNSVYTGKPKEYVILDKESLELQVGQKEKLIAESNSSYEFCWSSSDENVVTVDNGGNIKAISEGQALITVSISPYLNATCIVKVYPSTAEVSKIVFDSNSVSINKGKQYEVNYQIVPEYAADKNLTWSTSDKTVAVASDGVIKAKKPGTCVISAKSSNGIKAKINVTVTDYYETKLSDYVYFDNSETKWDEVYAYWWNSNNARVFDIQDNTYGCKIGSDGYLPVDFPGTKMKKIAGTDIWQMRVPFNASYVVFNSGVPENEIVCGEICYCTSDLKFNHGINAGQLYTVYTNSAPVAGRGLFKTKLAYYSGNWSDYNGNYNSELLDYYLKDIPESQEFEYYENYNGNIAITGYNGDKTDVIIPSEIDGKKIESISSNTFKNCNKIKSINILCDILLGSGHFEGCSNLESLIVSENNTRYSSYDGVLYNKELTEMVLCPPGKTDITLPASVKSISYYGLKGLENVYVDSDNTEFSSFDGAVYNKDMTELIACPEYKKTISFPESLLSVNDRAFSGCAFLTSIDLPNRLERIGEFAFDDCEGLTSITLPDNVTDIGSYAFRGCRNLRSVILPKNLKNMEVTSLVYCNSLTKINISTKNKYFTTIDGVLFNKDVTKLIMYPCSSGRNSYTIPDTVIEIGDDSFRNIRNLVTIIFPENLSRIGDGVYFGDKWWNLQNDGVVYANKIAIGYKGDIPSDGKVVLKSGTIGATLKFSYNKDIQEIVFPEGIKYINGAANYSSLEKINIPDSVEEFDFDILGTPLFNNKPNGVVYIDDLAYCYKGDDISDTIDIKYGTKLIVSKNNSYYSLERCKTLNIPSSVIAINLSANNSYSSNLENINVSPDNQYYSSDDGILYNKDKTELIYVPIKKRFCCMPDTVTKIKKGAFGQDKYYGFIRFSNSLKEIKIDNISVNSVYLPKEITYISYDSIDFLYEVYGYKNTPAEKLALDKNAKFIDLEKTIETSSTGSYVISENSDKKSYILFTVPKDGTYIIKQSSDKNFQDSVTIRHRNQPSVSTTTSTPNNNYTNTEKLYQGDFVRISMSDSSSDINVSIQDKLTGKFYWNTESQLNNYYFHDNILEISNTENIYEVFAQENDLPWSLSNYIGNIVINEGIKSIGYHAFYDNIPKSTGWNEGLKKVYIPSSVTSIDEKAFTYLSYEPPTSAATSTSTTTPAPVVTTVVYPEYYIEKNMDYITICAPKGSYAETYAKENGFKFEEVAATAVTKVTLDKTSVILEVGETEILNSSVKPINTSDKTLTWYTTDKNVATVKDGIVTAVGKGTCKVYAKSTNGIKGTCTVTVTATDPLSNTSVINSDIVQIGDKVRISASANGGAGGYTYAYYYKRSANNTWKTLGTEFGTNSSVAFAPTAEASFDVKVIVKDKDGMTAEKLFTVTAVKELELTNVSVVGRENIKLGTAIPMIGKAVGGAGSYTYSFYFKRSTNTNWKLLGEKFQTAASARFKPTATGTYDIRIDVKDSSGKIVKKFFTATAK